MKKFLALSAVLALMGGSAAYAVPYASQIRVQGPSAFIGQNFNISYIINEQADTMDVTIDILDASDDVVASFPGTSNWGPNTVAWNLTTDNDEGDLVDEDEGFKVRITVDAQKPDEWNWFTMNRAIDQAEGWWTNPPNDVINHAVINDGENALFSRVRAHSVNVPWDQDSDQFGFVYLTSSHAPGDFDPGHGMVVRTTTDLRPPQDSLNNGRDTSVLRHPGSTDPSSHTFQDAWYMTEDPLNPEYYYVSGQASSGTRVYYGHITDSIGETVLGDGPGPRSIAVRADGTDRIIYLTHGNSLIDRAVVDANNQILEGDLVDILSLSVSAYSKQVMLDSAGNLYWLSRDGWVYRWPSSVVDTATTAGSLTEANADWSVDATGITANSGSGKLFELAETPDGDIIASSNEGLLLLGNVADSSVTLVLTGADVFFEFPATMPIATGFGSGLYSDAFGNIYFTDGATGIDLGVAGISPGGDTETVVNAPSSQTFDVILETSADRDWLLYQ
ncbi:MAG: hypothetical protein JJU11_15355 [Candidatus Sumerlaeia bacterium]|nr:hypothetical protein [Candidatus Sumerlaeia bacterium]